MKLSILRPGSPAFLKKAFLAIAFLKNCLQNSNRWESFLDNFNVKIIFSKLKSFVLQTAKIDHRMS
jgi:hypothetical protein